MNLQVNRLITISDSELMENETMKIKLSKPYKCKCGHVIPLDGKVMKDHFSQIRGVRRVIAGNALCPKCKQPIPFDCVDVLNES